MAAVKLEMTNSQAWDYAVGMINFVDERDYKLLENAYKRVVRV